MAFKDTDKILVNRDGVDYKADIGPLMGGGSGGGSQPGDGKLTIKDSDGTKVGEFTANQSGDSVVNLPAVFSGNYNDLTDKPDINNGKLTIKDSDGKSLGDFTANQSGNKVITLPAATVSGGGGVATGPQYTRKDGSWKINYTTDGPNKYDHRNEDGKYVDGALIDDGTWVLVGSHETHRAMSEHNLRVQIGLSWLPGDTTDHRGDFREAFSVAKYVANSITYCPDSSQLLWLQYKNEGNEKEVWSSTYDPSLSIEQSATGLSVPVKLKEGNVGITVYAHTTEKGQNWRESPKKVGIWEFDSNEFTLFSIEGGGALTKVVSTYIEEAKEIFEVCGLIVSTVVGEWNTDIFLRGAAYYREAIIYRHLFYLKMESGEYSFSPACEINALDLEINLAEHPVLESASFATTMILMTKSFCIINSSDLNSAYLVSRKANARNCSHFPKIAKIGNYYICNLSDKQQFNFWGLPGGSEEELAMTNATPVMSIRTPLEQEAVQVITSNSEQLRECWFTSKADDSEAYESCTPVLDASIKDGNIIVDHNLAHGQRYYFADVITWEDETGDTYNELIALSSQCHRA